MSTSTFPWKLLLAGSAGIIALFAIVLTGIALSAEYSKVVRIPTSVNATGIDLPLTNNTVRVGTSGQYPFLISATTCRNTSHDLLLDANNYTVIEGDADGGYLRLCSECSDQEDWIVYCDIAYRADSAGQAAADAFAVGLAIFSSFCAIIAISLIGREVVRMYKKKRKSADQYN